MTIHNLKFRDDEVLISIGAKRSTVAGYVSNSDISRILTKSGTSHYLDIDGVILTERKAAISLEAQLMKWVGEIDISETSDWIVLFPFDKVIYVAFLDVAENYVSVAEERLITFDELNLIRREARADEFRNYDFLLINGGELTEVVKGAGFSGIATDSTTQLPIVLHVKPSGKGRSFWLKKKTEFAKVFAPLAGVFALIAAAWVWQNYEPKQQTNHVVIAPKSAKNIGYQLTALAHIIQLAKPLLHHGIREISVTADSIVFTGELVPGNVDFPRLQEIALKLNAQLDLNHSGWRIYQFALDYPHQAKVELRPLVNTVQSIIEIDNNHIIESRIGVVRDRSKLGKDRTDQLSANLIGVDAASIQSLGDAFKNKEIFGKLIKAHLSRSAEGLWTSLKLDIEIKGS